MPDEKSTTEEATHVVEADDEETISVDKDDAKAQIKAAIERDKARDAEDSAPPDKEPEEEPPAEEESAEPEPDDEPEEFNQDLKARAARLGIDPTVARAFEAGGSAAEFRKYLDGVEKTAEQTTETEPATEDTIPEVPELNLDPDLYDADTIKAFDVIRDQAVILREQLMETRTQLSTVLDAVERQGEASDLVRLDDLASTAGPQFKKLLADGNARLRVRDAMNVIRAGLEAVGREVPPEGELFQKAARQEFGTELEQIAADDIRARARKRSQRTTARPTQRNGRSDSGTPEQRAVAKVSERMGELGLDDPYAEIRGSFLP